MKHTFILFLLFFAIKTHSQTISPSGLNNLSNFIDSLEGIDKKTRAAVKKPDNLLVSKVGLNKFFAKKIGYFLTGKDNPSLHRNYLFLDAGENDLVLGHNRYFTAENDRILSVLTLGLKADLKDNFGELANQDGLKGNFGVNLKYTYYIFGTVKYDNLSQSTKSSEALVPKRDQKCSMNHKRHMFLKDQIERLQKEALEFEKAKQAFVSEEDTESCRDKGAMVKESEDEFYKDLKKKYLEAYYAKEVELLEDPDAKNFVHASWVSATGFFPIAGKSYSVTTSTTELPKERKSYLTDIGVSFYYLMEFKENGRVLISAGASGKNNNSIENEELDKYTINDLHKLGLNDSVYIHPEEGDVYYGAYQEYISGTLYGEGTYLPKIKGSKIFTGNWGISGRYEYAYDGLNDKVNVKVGLPFILKGKDEESAVNFELQFKMKDVYRWTSDKQKFSFGISVGLPFSSLLYKK
jgi:hypothetical protein